MSTWFEIVTPIALIEPTFFGELVLIAGAVIIGIAAICEAVENSKSESDSKPKEAPKSVTEGEKKNEQSSPGKMQKEVERGQAPKNVKSVHNPSNGKPHIHFKDGTSMNNDGTPHDKGNGIPKLTKETKKWLEKHNWPTEIVFP